MNDHKHINHLFNRLLDNSISEEELQLLLKYIRTSDSDIELKELMGIHWEDIKDELIEKEPGLQTEKRYQAILQKIDQSHRKPGSNRLSSPSKANPTLRWIGIAASILILVSAGLYWGVNSHKPSESPLNSSLATMNFSGKQVVNLPDGSTVILNEDSQLTYTEAFGQQTRAIEFSGEGYFDVVHDPDRPFIVHTGEVKTTVLGTAFNLKAYDEQSNVEVTVTRGKVAVGDEKQVFDKILPHQQMVVDKNTHVYKRENVDVDKVLAWQKDFLIIDAMTVENAAELIAKKHHVEISIVDSAVKNCKISASFIKGESLDQILRVVCGVLQAEYRIDGNKVEVTGGRKCE